MEDQRCSLPSISKLLCLDDASSPLNKSSPTSWQHCPPVEVSHSSRSRGQAGSEWTQSPRRGPPPTPPMSIDASFEGCSFPPTKPFSRSCSGSAPRLYCYVTTPPLEAGAHCQASITALPQATLPVLAPRPQQTHHAEDANTAVQVFPAVQALEKTNTRASQACDNCRKQKAKCDETKPCTTCKRKGAECKYRDPVPKATDKAQADILEAIGSIHTTLNSARIYLGRFDERLIKIESLLLESLSVTNGASTDPANFIATPVPQRSPSGAS
ncbi:Activator of stress genes 1 [Fusarium oxysporum f. sp. cubense]|nr:Activator of stress genes 1 [Fusarium oxysporum f. sp. cubense]